MANRFRMAAKNAGDEILSVGKQGQDKEETIKTLGNDVKVDVEVKEIVYSKKFNNVPKDFFIEKELSITNISENLEDDSDTIRISEFLKAKISEEVYELRLNKLKEIMDALIVQVQTQKPIIITDNKENIILWVKAIRNGIPQKLRHIVAFRIYEEENTNDYENCIIFNNLVFPQVNIPFEKSSLNFQVFDFSKICNSYVNMGSNYSELLQVGYLLNDDKFHEFKKFFDEFEYNNLDQNLNKCLMLFYYANTGVKNLDYNSIDEALNFAESYGNSITYNNLFKNMNFNVNMDEKMAFINTKFMLKTAKELQDKDCYSKTYGFIFDYIQNLLSKNTEKDISYIFDLFDKIYNLEENDSENFINYALDSQNTNKFLTYIINEDNNFALFYLTIILEMLSYKGNKWSDNLQYIDFIDKGIELLSDSLQIIESVISSVSENLEYKANLILLYYKKFEDDNEKRNLILKLLYSQNSSNKGIIEFITETKAGATLVLDEFKEKLLISLNKAKYFWDYKSQIFDENIKFRDKYFSQAVDFYLKNIRKDHNYSEELTRVLNIVSLNQVEISNDVVIYLINDYENEIPLIVTDDITKLNLKNISRIKKAKNITTTNVNFSMIEYGNRVEKSINKETTNSLIDNEFPNLKDVSDEKVEEFFYWCLDLYLNNNVTEATDMVTFYNKIKQIKGNVFGERIFKDNKFLQLNNTMNTLEPKKIGFYLFITLDYFIKQGRIWNNENLQEEFIKNAIVALDDEIDILKYSLNMVIENTKYFTEMLSVYSNGKNAKTIGLELFIKNSNIKGEEWTYEVKNCIDTWLNGEDILIEEFKLRYNVAINKNRFFWMYLDEIQLKLPSFKNRKLVDLLEIYINTLQENDFNIEACITIFKYLSKYNVEISKETVTSFITKFEDNINITSLDTDLDEIADKFIAYKKNNAIKTNPDIMGIVSFSLKLQKVNSPAETLELIVKNEIKFVGLSKEKYLEFVQWSLSIIGEKINIIDKSNDINRAICVTEFREEYLKVYNDLLVTKINDGSLTLTKQYFQDAIKYKRNSFDVIANLIAIHFGQCLANNDAITAVKIFVDIVNECGNLKLSRSQVRKYFIDLKNGDELLFEEYKYRLENAPIKANFYSSYWDEFVTGFEEYKHLYYEQALEQYVVSIKNTSDFAQACYGLLKQIKRDDIQLSNEVLIQILLGCEKLITIGEQDDNGMETIKNISEFKAERNIVTSPDIVNYVNFGMKISKTSNLDEIRKMVRNFNLDLKDIDSSRYEEWIEWCIPKVIHSGNTWQSHAAIKKAMCSDKLKGIFFTTYIVVLSDELKLDSFDDIFASFIIFFINGKDQIGGEIYTQGRANIVNVLSRCTETKIENIDKLITAGCYEIRTRESIAEEWEQIKSRFTPVAKPEKGFLGKVFKR